jgi:hypothetical protein
MHIITRQRTGYSVSSFTSYTTQTFAIIVKLRDVQREGSVSDWTLSAHWVLRLRLFRSLRLRKGGCTALCAVRSLPTLYRTWIVVLSLVYPHNLHVMYFHTFFQWYQKRGHNSVLLSLCLGLLWSVSPSSSCPCAESGILCFKKNNAGIASAACYTTCQYMLYIC